MKFAVINDTHFGVRNDAQVFDQYFERFYEEIFFPTLLERKIDRVLHLGDVFDRRKYVNYVTLSSCNRYFFNKFREHGIELTALVGNHDTYFKNTNEINSLDLLLNGKGIRIIIGPQEWVKDEILLIPWICPDNFVQTIEQIEKTKANLCFGHLELAGFEMHKGSPLAAGLDSKVFDKFHIVASGHFHHKSTRRNIRYLGAPYQMTWADYDDDRGFNIFDTNSREFEYIKNPYQIFNKLYYDDKDMNAEKLFDVDFNHYKDTYVKVVIVNKTNPYWFDIFIDKLTEAGAYDVQPVDSSISLEIGDDADINIDAEDTLTILSKYVNQLDFRTDKARLDNLFKSLYNDSLNLE
jgi:DNA repair exonuclease SbcCD nuclease subunit